jgi:hypothetical protein
MLSCSHPLKPFVIPASPYRIPFVHQRAPRTASLRFAGPARADTLASSTRLFDSRHSPLIHGHQRFLTTPTPRAARVSSRTFLLLMSRPRTPPAPLLRCERLIHAHLRHPLSTSLTRTEHDGVLSFGGSRLYLMVLASSVEQSSRA